MAWFQSPRGLQADFGEIWGAATMKKIQAFRFNFSLAFEPG